MPRIEPNGLQARLIPVHARVLPVRRRACARAHTSPKWPWGGVIGRLALRADPSAPRKCEGAKGRATWASCPARALHARVLPLWRRACAHAPTHLCWAVPSCNSRCELACRPLACAIFKSRATWAPLPGSCLACARLASKAACMHICTFSANAWSSLTSVSRIASFQGEAAISSLTHHSRRRRASRHGFFSSLVLCSSRLGFLRVMPGKL